ncbi:thiosulfate/3-mercaptopyruvate sulfurtransferase [Thalassobacillus cyri]|uniref:Thiosulfate/3-mercaptopyruvate sulfurtransferase n=1 Tax=Thalassobacillus cyri TaxID=571932 RepID=A0A1H4CSG2_9BACI|nr:sulfurtransferase [Thalassobacillus cyri]SEA63326.1 thiosulfate/3-mercaptopyruvate sulfurtransferase [Thalassobacillus cyri]
MSNVITVARAKHWSEEKKVVFADCRFDLSDPDKGQQKYDEGHLPGAVYFDLEKSLSGEIKQHGGRHPLPELESFKETLANAGIDRETFVIAYDQNRSVMAARMLWLLKYVGHGKVYLLDGGIDAWTKAGLPLEKEAPRLERAASYPIELQHDMACGEAYVRARQDEENTVLVDSRSFERYAGWKEPIDIKSGHIPGAVQYDWVDVYKEDGTWKSKAELQQHFQELSDHKEIIVYCGSGVTAASNVIGLWEAGMDQVKLYVGSFSDWISYQENEVATIDKQ